MCSRINHPEYNGTGQQAEGNGKEHIRQRNPCFLFHCARCLDKVSPPLPPGEVYVRGLVYVHFRFFVSAKFEIDFFKG